MESIKLVELKDKADLNPRQRKAILALMTCRTIREAAQEARVRLPTLYLWLKQETFSKELERMREEIISDSVARLKVYSLQAVTVLAELMNHSESETVRRGCATDLLDNCRAFIGMKDLEKRLEAIENTLSQSSQDNKGTTHYEYKAKR